MSSLEKESKKNKEEIENKEIKDKTENKGKQKKKVRNKGRDILGDYYKVNKKYGEENREAYEKQEEEKGETKGKKKPFNSTERLYIIVIVLGLIGIGIKYLFF